MMVEDDSWASKTRDSRMLPRTLLHLRLPLDGGTATGKAEVEFPTNHRKLGENESNIELEHQKWTCLKNKLDPSF